MCSPLALLLNRHPRAFGYSSFGATRRAIIDAAHYSDRLASGCSIAGNLDRLTALMSTLALRGSTALRAMSATIQTSAQALELHSASTRGQLGIPPSPPPCHNFCQLGSAATLSVINPPPTAQALGLPFVPALNEHQF